MDDTDARRQLDAFAVASHDSGRGRLPVLPAALAAVAAALALILLGWDAEGRLLLATRLVGVAFGCVAFGLPAWLRSRAGLHGTRGQAQSDNLVFVIVAVALGVTGLSADHTLSVIYVGLGLVGGLLWFLVLRGRDGRRPDAAR